MRFRSKKSGGFQVFAVSGVNTVSFGISATDAAKRGLLGFAVERTDAEGKTKVVPGFKVFPSIVPEPDESTRVSTREHPVQSFVWDDFTARDGAHYEYRFIPMKGTPGALKALQPIAIGVNTEPLFSDLEHDIFFNRGVASSQAYTREFGNKKPDKLPKAKAAEAREWLSRRLDEALLEFVAQARKGDALRCCFYEFRYRPVVDALKEAIERGVDVKVIIDAKNNGKVDKKTGEPQPPFPRDENLAVIKKAKISREKHIILREARTDEIQHNKFMILCRGKKQVPSEVWTGSTNISEGGIHGQTNVGHWIRNGEVADRFLAYWNLLSDDPGGTDGDDRTTARQKNDALRKAVAELNDIPTSIDDIENGVTPVFSPRGGLKILDLYFDLVDTAASTGCITLAFGVNKDFKQKLLNNTAAGHIVFLLLEKRDAPKKNAREPFVALNATNNVYQAFGSFLRNPLYQWTKETNARLLDFNRHVTYIHSKFLLRDPLGADPIVVTGSANFSKASTNDNDENMLIIRGDRRVADIYFTEFNRLFNHYYFRAVHERTRGRDAEGSLFLAEDDSWLAKYEPGKLKRKRLDLYTGMQGFA